MTPRGEIVSLEAASLGNGDGHGISETKWLEGSYGKDFGFLNVECVLVLDNPG